MDVIILLVVILATGFICKPYLDKWVLAKATRLKTKQSKEQLIAYHNLTK